MRAVSILYPFEFSINSLNNLVGSSLSIQQVHMQQKSHWLPNRLITLGLGCGDKHLSGSSTFVEHNIFLNRMQRLGIACAYNSVLYKAGKP